ncbi:Rpp14/Pop5 family protein [Candidatus Bathyarchaeota archaeon]|nr:Rpp14/Pop5 family protein [Candidatus Bathyarchaeota archaeon]
MRIKTRRRYLALKIDAAEKFEQKVFLDALWSAILRLYGEYGASKTGLTLIDYNTEKGIAIIRAAHTEVEKVRAAIATITEINGNPAAVHVLFVSGTLKVLHRKIGISH